MNNEELFKCFLEKYLENVKAHHPMSYRTQQLEMGGVAAEAVRVYETIFLKQPFIDALKEARK